MLIKKYFTVQSWLIGKQIVTFLKTKSTKICVTDVSITFSNGFESNVTSPE